MSKRCEKVLASLTNYERDRPTRTRWSLDGMRLMLGDRRLSGVAVQIGGSKGKGTTALYLEALARDMGLRTGLFMSPHLERVTERVRIDGEELADRSLAVLLQEVLDQAATADVPMSYFEAVTLAAHEAFWREEVDLAIFEVGLGGRYDATTAIPVDASILTQVELEHTALLGETITAIATEKSFVIRQGKPVFTAATGAALSVFQRRAEEVEADCLVSPGQLRLESVQPTETGWSGSLVYGDQSQAFRLDGASQFELPALLLSWACLGRLFPDRHVALCPVPRPALPGRFEVWRLQPDVLILDGSHTVASIQLVAEEVQRRFLQHSVATRPVVALFGTAIDKDWREALRPLLPLVDSWVITGISGTVAEDPGRIVAWLVEHGGTAQVVADEAGAFAAWLSLPAEVRLVTGSFYLAGMVRRQLQEAKSTHE